MTSLIWIRRSSRIWSYTFSGIRVKNLVDSHIESSHVFSLKVNAKVESSLSWELDAKLFVVCDYILKMSEESRNAVDDEISNRDHFIEREIQDSIEAHNNNQVDARQVTMAARPRLEGWGDEDLLCTTVDVL